jgi:hypothetical protein
MTNKEALFFVGKCLSLSVHPERASDIKSLIQTGSVDWKLVVYQSSSQFVLPALYLNLKRNNLLTDLPEDLIEHFKEITRLNRERNESILQQLKAITNLLNENGIKPIFLKGTAHLLDGLYVDIAERMIGDIDFLLEEKQTSQAYFLLIENGYKSLIKNATPVFGDSQHLPRLVKGSGAAVEIHRRMLNGRHNKHFNWFSVKDKTKKTLGLAGSKVFSDSDLILHNIFNAQIKDKGRSQLKIFMRQNYDLLLLSKRENPLTAIKSFKHYFKELNTYIALSAHLFAFPKTLAFVENKSAKRYIRNIHFVWDHHHLAKAGRLIHFIVFRIYGYFKTGILFFISSATRKRVITSLSDPSYYGNHLAQYKKWL